MTTRLKVAVLFFGQPRNIQNRLSAISHRIWLRKHDVDYFGHCWYADNPSLFTGGLNVKKISIPHHAPKLLKKIYPGIQLFSEKPIDFSTDSKIARYFPVVNNVKSSYQHLLPVYTSQFFSINKVIENFFESGFKEYDFVVLSRYDNLILRIEDISKFPKNKLIVSDSRSFFADLIFIGQKMHNQALNTYPDLSVLLETEDDFAPEELKRAAFFRKFQQDDVISTRLNIAIIRSPSLVKNIYLLAIQFVVYVKNLIAKNTYKKF